MDVELGKLEAFSISSFLSRVFPDMRSWKATAIALRSQLVGLLISMVLSDATQKMWKRKKR